MINETKSIPILQIRCNACHKIQTAVGFERTVNDRITCNKCGNRLPIFRYWKEVKIKGKFLRPVIRLR